MAHDVKFSIPKRTLGKSDVEFDVNRDGSKLGYFENIKRYISLVSFRY